jgi:hypothetical protein
MIFPIRLTSPAPPIAGALGAPQAPGAAECPSFGATLHSFRMKTVALRRDDTMKKNGEKQWTTR